jgi:3-oxoadipate enol-lactonase/4-carboxymuconolactone decarboxylase
MPFARRGGLRIYWKLEGAADRPALVLLNSIGTDMGVWDRALPHLLRSFRVLRIDTRGHGASDAPDEDYSLSELAADVLAVMDAAEIQRAAVAGVSLGGMMAMELALAAPERVAALVLICTSAEMDKAAWAERVARVRSVGTSAIADLAITRFLSPGFAKSNPEVEAGLRRNLLTMQDFGYAGAAAAIRDMDLIGRISGIGAPSLVVAGNRDASTPCAGHGDRIATLIDGAQLLQLDCAHLAPVEAPADLAGAMQRFLLATPAAQASEEALFESGLVNRRRILGEAWVEQALACRTPFNSDFQALITRIVWHEVWGRPGLDDRTRRLLVVAMTASLGRWEEFRLHVRSGLAQQGFTSSELKETLIQTAVYAGVPAANTAFHEAMAVMDALGSE